MLVTTNGVKYKIERDKFIWGNAKVYRVSVYNESNGQYNKPDIYSTKDLVKAKIVVFA
jgi:hypothetical protein